MTSSTGRYERITVFGEDVRAFVPHALPPQPPVALSPALQARLLKAELALSRLELGSAMVPSLDWFLYAFVRKEAVLSSQIEGTQASLVDLLAYEAHHEGTPSDDVEEVCNYLDALKFAREELANPTGLPLSMRLLNESHRRLMAGARGATKAPGEVRKSQNWNGGSRPGNAVLVPPPPQELPRLLGDLEKYLHADDNLPPLVRAGLVHVQFETIHPYLDGNGRIGRLLVTLLLQHWGLLGEPLLYLSLFFKRHQAEYSRRLCSVRTDGDWAGWLDFFLDGVATVATEALAATQQVYALVADDRRRVLAHPAATMASVRLFELLPRHPIVTVARVVAMLEVTKPSAGRAIDALVGAGVLQETTGRRRDRTFAYGAYLDVLRVGTELR